MIILIERLLEDVCVLVKLVLWNVLNVIIFSNSVFGMFFVIVLGGFVVLFFIFLIGVFEGMMLVFLIDCFYEIFLKS